MDDKFAREIRKAKDRCSGKILFYAIKGALFCRSPLPYIFPRQSGQCMGFASEIISGTANDNWVPK